MSGPISCECGNINYAVTRWSWEDEVICLCQKCGRRLKFTGVEFLAIKPQPPGNDPAECTVWTIEIEQEGRKDDTE